MTHVVINNITPRTTLSPTTGTSYTIPATWGFFASSDIVVYSGTTQLSYAAAPSSSTNFATSGSAVDGGYQGGNIVLGAASTANNITLVLDVPVERATDFPYPAATINIEDLNTDLDKSFALMQQFVRDLARTPGMADSDTGSVGTLPSTTERAGYLFAWDTTGGATIAPNAAATVPVTIANGGTSATTAAGARTNLGLAIGTDVFTQRTFTGTTNEIDVAAGNGSTGNPTFSIPTAVTFTGKTITGGTFNSASFTSGTITGGTGSSVVLTGGSLTSGTITAGTWTSGTISSLASPLQVAYGGTSATTSSGAVANLNIAYDLAFNAGFSSTGGTANIVAQTYGEVISGRALTALSEQGYIATAGSTQAVIVDIEVNGSSIYSTKPQFGTTNALTAGTISNTTIAAGDRVTFKVTQIGSTGTPGAGLRFTLLTKMRV